jgi:hypothetical protein
MNNVITLVGQGLLAVAASGISLAVLQFAMLS